MASPLLSTKLYNRSPRWNIVPRPRLNEQLDEGIYHRLILISAPAGFGKTTLLSGWINKLDLPVAWIPLDKADYNQNGFLAYIFTDLQTIKTGICETVQAMLQSPQSPPQETILTEFINEVASIEQNFFLVLSDYHVIKAEVVNNALTFLLDHLPPRQ